MASPSTHPSELALAGFDLGEPSVAPTDGERCDVCDEIIVGEPAGYGCYLFARGDEIHEERPPLCELCATAIAVKANAWMVEEEEDG